MQFHFTNVNDAFQTLVKWFEREAPTVNTDSRAGRVKYVQEPVMVIYEKPMERVLFNPYRDCNPFFHLFESLWMLAGRNDVAPLAYYNGKIAEIASDNGVTFNGAYGARWRCMGYWDIRKEDYGDTDQITLLIEHLQKNPLSRRAVLQVWNVGLDLLKVDTTKDVPCLVGTTRFKSPEGNKSIKTLAKKFQTTKGFRYPVYAVDILTGNTKLTWMTNAWKSGVKRVYKVHFDDGTFLTATGDHIVYKKKKVFDGQRCVGLNVQETCICDLQVGDRLLATTNQNHVSSKDNEGHWQFKRNIYHGTYYRNMIKEHREYYELVYSKIKGDYDIHHVDNNPANNKINNLQKLKASDHARIGKFGENNPHCKMSKAAKKARGKKHSASMKIRWGGMDAKTRRAFACRKATRTARQWELIEEHISSKSNHKIIKIEKLGYEAVYDFTVPGRHNAVLDNGVVVHNCNTTIYFSIRTEMVEEIYEEPTPLRFLDMTVCNRSNDMIWGMLGANVVHLSILQEYMADCLDISVGRYTQFTNNLHVYLNNWSPDIWLDYYENRTMFSPRLVGYSDDLRPYPLLVKDKKIFDLEVGYFTDNLDADYSEPFLAEVAQPMMKAFRAHKERNYVGSNGALAIIEEVEADDWRIAGNTWLTKRYKSYANSREEAED